MPNTVCIIVPVLNEFNTINNRIDELHQYHQQSTLIFVDAGSSDGTSQLLTDQGMTVVHAERKGRGAQLVAGVLRVPENSQSLLFMHIDTHMPDNFQQLITNALQNHHWGHFNLRFDSSQPMFKLIALMMNLRATVTGISTGDQCLFVNKEIFLLYEDKVRKHPLMEDVYLSKILKKHHQRGAVIKQTVCTSSRYWNKHGILRTILKMWIFRLLYFFGVSPNTLYKHYYKR